MEKKSADDCSQGRERVMEHHTHSVIKPVGEIIYDLIQVHVHPIYTISQKE
jgi:hypothetical protein